MLECVSGAGRTGLRDADQIETGVEGLVFELRGDATLYVAYDKRIAQIPSWLSSWKLTGDQIVNSHSTVYTIYSKEFVGGRVILGANCGTSDDAMYLLLVSPQLCPSLPLPY